VALPTRERILLAALSAFTEQGIEGATIGDIRRLSGASTGSIYHHFPNKEGLAAALYLEGIARYQGGISTVLSTRPAGQAGVRGIVAHHLGWAVQHPDWARFLLATHASVHRDAEKQKLDEMNRAFTRALFAWLQAAMDRGELRRVPLDVAVPMLIGPPHEFVRQWLSGQVRILPTERIEDFADAAWRALKGGDDG
jgi:AcrR family transcriptional regulator